MNLTPSEAHVLQLASEGLLSKQIAQRRGTSIETVKQHLRSARVKLLARNTSHAVAIGIRRGLLSPEAAPGKPKNGEGRSDA